MAVWWKFLLVLSGTTTTTTTALLLVDPTPLLIQHTLTATIDHSMVSSSLQIAAASAGMDPGLFGASAPTPATWPLRIGSALCTYFGFVAFTDRPRGKLMVPLETPQEEGFLKIRQSLVPGAGLGLFASRSMPKGTVLGTYPGVLLPLQQHSNASKLRTSPQCLAYIWRFTDNAFVMDPTDHSTGVLPEDGCRGGNPSQFASVEFWNLLHLLLRVPKPSTALCRINEPPIGKDVNVVTEERLEERTVVFVLERDVYAGEELHIDYGLTYDRSGYASGK